MINIKADKAVKRNAQKLAEELGLTLSAVVNASLKQFIRTRQVHFEAPPEKMSPKLEKMIGELEKDIKNNRNLSPAFKNGKDMDEYLRSL